MNTSTKLIVPEQRAKQLEAPSESSSMLIMIERASRDPAVDIEKIKQLFALRKQIIDEEREAVFNDAMNAAQAEMSVVAADATNPQTRSKYASYGQLDSAIRPIYTRHGFAVSFNEADSPKPDHVRVVGYLTHKGGFTRTYHTDMPADGKGAKGGDVMTKTHAVGSAKSYGKRYILKDAFNIAVGEEDRDGNTDTPAKITVDQVKELEKLIVEVGADRQKFMRYIKVNALDEILARSFTTVRSALESKRRSAK